MSLIADYTTDHVFKLMDPDDTIIEWHLILWSISGGVEIELVADSINVKVDPNNAIDSVSTVEVFNLLSRQSIVDAISRNYVSCPIDCQTPALVTVRTSSCVARSGSGVTTAFAPCTTGACRRHYSVCGNSTDPTITMTGSTTDGCVSSGCSGTCP